MVKFLDKVGKDWSLKCVEMLPPLFFDQLSDVESLYFQKIKINVPACRKFSGWERCWSWIRGLDLITTSLWVFFSCSSSDHLLLRGVNFFGAMVILGQQDDLPKRRREKKEVFIDWNSRSKWILGKEEERKGKGQLYLRVVKSFSTYMEVRHCSMSWLDKFSSWS